MLRKIFERLSRTSPPSLGRDTLGLGTPGTLGWGWALPLWGWALQADSEVDSGWALRGHSHWARQTLENSAHPAQTPQ